jgi:hypothetical protein
MKDRERGEGNPETGSGTEKTERNWKEQGRKGEVKCK